MKIALFTYSMLELGGGVAKYYIEVAAGLKKKYPDLELSIVTFDEKLLRKILFLYLIYFWGKQDISVSHKEISSSIRSKLKDVSYYKAESINKLKKKLQEFDAIYSTNNLLEILIIKLFIGYKHLPAIVYGFHIPMFYPFTKSIQSRLHNLIYNSRIYFHAISPAKKFHVLNEFDKNLLRKRLPSERIIKIHNPFNLPTHSSGIAEEKKINKNKSINVLWVGRITEQKGIDDLIIIIDILNKSGHKNSIMWNIVGEGDLRKDVVKLAKRWNNVCFHGYVKNDFMSRIYRENNILIVTSKWESFPYVILEAQSFGLPVISYDIPGCREIILNNKSGYLVKDRAQFIKRLIQYIDQPAILDTTSMIVYGKKRFSVGLILDKLYNFFTGD